MSRKQKAPAPLEYLCKRSMGLWYITYGEDVIAMCTREEWALRILATLRGEIQGEAPEIAWSSIFPDPPETPNPMESK